ncbi:hypothetical protein QP020_09455 [Gallibacterium anatis]|uniref:hypothetical protein n=1 Tax=Gallibacterium anatis TaxID=750 RepID=UPI00255084B4|nr:hypothetical protein [Gallibacterium anatis]WIM83986.1 hypothetical protein QP020_09455 [Gallibacterium anatis]
MNILIRLRKTFFYTLGFIIPVQGMIWIKRYLDKNIIDQSSFFFNKEYLYVNFKFFYGCGSYFSYGHIVMSFGD